MMNSEKSFKQDFLDSIFGLSQPHVPNSPWHCREFPPVEASEFHTVLFEIPADRNLNESLKAKIGEDKWDQDHVKLPCSDCNVYTLNDSEGHILKKWDLIKNALSKPIGNSQEFLKAVLIYHPGFKDIWKFKALHRFFNEYWEETESKKFFEETLPKVVRLALSLPELIKSPIPLLKQGENKSISFTQQQLASLFANAFLCTFPERNNKRKESEYRNFPPVNFNSLYDGGGPKVMEKLKCICHYLTRITSDIPTGVVTFSRRHIPIEKCPDWDNCSIPITKTKVFTESNTLIEDADGCIQVDFANRYIGGGVLRRGAVQEEIRFVSNPELIVSLLFTEVMGPTEAVMIIGTERFSTHSGYSMTFQWSGDYRDNTPKDSSGRRRCAILALDARRFPKPDEQYTKEMVDRELNKAYTGFSFYSMEKDINYPGIATGNWGCGAFGGNARLKSLLQLMACVLAGRNMAYYTFGDIELRDDIRRIYNTLVERNVTVGDLYKKILEFCASNVARTNLYGYLEDNLKK